MRVRACAIALVDTKAARNEASRPAVRPSASVASPLCHSRLSLLRSWRSARQV